MHRAGSREAIRQALWSDEQACIRERLAQARLTPEREALIGERARDLVKAVRESTGGLPGLDAFLHEYDLSTHEGVLLMCLAEALLRIPDSETADRLIQDRLSRGQWDSHLGSSDSLLVNASSWGLLLTGRLVAPAAEQQSTLEQLRQFIARVGEPLARVALQQSMQLLARQFVLGRDIPEALARSAAEPAAQTYSYDCLGEAALTTGDVEHFYQAYHSAIGQLAEQARPDGELFDQPGISIKLSALHPRYEFAQRKRVYAELLPRLESLFVSAAGAGISVTIDAEEAERLELSLDIFSSLLEHPKLAGWNGLGLAVQAYQKRAYPVLQWLQQRAKAVGKVIPVRLVKGAYWDTEIKRAQQQGLAAYPVFTRKAATDVSYLACARYLLTHTDCFYPQFASHNAFTIAWVMALATRGGFELQRLHGMGEALFTALVDRCDSAPATRVYAPVGDHEALLPYLVRRLLENGANSSFVNQLFDAEVDIDQLVANPCEQIVEQGATPNPHIPLPARLFGDVRINARGYDFSDPDTVESIDAGIGSRSREVWQARPLTGRASGAGQGGREILDPADQTRLVGRVFEATPEQVEEALTVARSAQIDWDAQGGARRADCLCKTADLFEADAASLVARIVREGGRTLPDAYAELREAVDFCRYYASRAEAEFTTSSLLPGPSGERNELALHGRGVFACISPWNFPLAIFAGQVAAALAAGNTVIAKPAGQTPLTAARAVELFHRAGIPAEVLHFLPGPGGAIGAQLCADERLSGVAFTGSTDTARRIQQALAARSGPIVPLIAETGGQNVMIADSSALLQQLVVDVIQSAFNSAGQRCSALRVLFIQNDIADAFIELLRGAMDELTIGDPARRDTDIGPLIDSAAREQLERHRQRMHKEAGLVHRLNLDEAHGTGSYFAPCAYEIDSLGVLEREVFGPVLHLVRYSAGDLDSVVDQVNRTGYGLTLGVHSRIEATWQRVSARARVGNLYINRNMIGAVVGVQPFGGEGLSGTGPKAGGPYYLHRFATERTRSINTAALGGDAGLLSLGDD